MWPFSPKKTRRWTDEARRAAIIRLVTQVFRLQNAPLTDGAIDRLMAGTEGLTEFEAGRALRALVNHEFKLTDDALIWNDLACAA